MQEKPEGETNVGETNLAFDVLDRNTIDGEENMTPHHSDNRNRSMSSHPASKHFPFSRQPSQNLLDNSDDELLDDISPKRFISIDPESVGSVSNSAGPSGKQTLNKVKSPALQRMQQRTFSHSDSDESDELGNTKKKKAAVPGEYNAAMYDDLDVSNEIKEVFQYIIKYVPQQLSLDFKFKPFVPDFIPAVGDIDAFLKVIPPQNTLSGDDFKFTESQMGLLVLDEPVANQSDPALLHLQLRAASITVSHANETMVVKKIDDVEKNSKIIDKWIKDVSDLHRNKSTTTVKYTDPMPDVDELLQEWPEQFENSLKQFSLPNPKFGGTLSQYIDILCAVFDIPIYKNRIESLHVLFSLFVNVKNAQIYPAYSEIDGKETRKPEADHLVLD